MNLTFKKTQTVKKANDKASSIYQIVSGTVGIYNQDNKLVGLLLKGEYIGEFEYFTNSAYTNYYISLDDVELELVKLEADWMRITQNVAKAAKTLEFMVSIAKDSSAIRVVKTIIWLANKACSTNSSSFIFPFSNTVLSELAAINSQTVSREVTKLKKLGLINTEIGYSEKIITNWNGIQKLS